MLDLITEYNFYLYVACTASALFGVKLILLLVAGVDDDGIVDIDDTDLDLDGSESFKLISLQTILAFLMGFGWMGLALRYEQSLSSVWSAIGASVFGFVIMYAMAKATSYLRKLNSPTATVMPKVNNIGQVYTPLAVTGTGDCRGKIELAVGDRLTIVDAVAKEPIGSFEKVKVTSVVSPTLVQVVKV